MSTKMNTNIKETIENMVAVAGEQVGILGQLTWYNISRNGIKDYDLKDLLCKYGLQRYMLKPRNKADAARCAMSDSEVSWSEAGGTEINKLFFVEVYSDKKEVTWKLVGERVDKKGKRLWYDPDVATIRFDKEQETFEESGCYEVNALGVIDKAIKLYHEYKEVYMARHIRELAARVLDDMSPIPVKSSGGVYIVPASDTWKLETLVSFINELGESESYMIPLINNSENKDMIRKKLCDHVNDTIKQVTEFLKNERVDKCNTNLKLGQVKKTISDFTRYQQELSLEMGDMGELIDLLKQQSKKLLDRVAEAA